MAFFFFSIMTSQKPIGLSRTKVNILVIGRNFACADTFFSTYQPFNLLSAHPENFPSSDFLGENFIWFDSLRTQVRKALCHLLPELE